MSYVPTTEEKIAQLRRMMVTHSCLYYVFGLQILTDKEFDDFAYQLVELQKKYPEISKSVEFEREAFKDFDGSTGFDLPIWTEQARGKAEYVYKLHRELHPEKNLKPWGLTE